MNASYEWLNELVPAGLTPAEMADVITSRCATVDGIIRLRSDLAGVVIARVVTAGAHPNSDHLWVTTVDAGTGELLDVVCGAPNVKAGALYPFAPVGTTLPGGITLEKRKIRGQLSNGMLCSARELGLGEDHAGIMELSLDVPLGTPLLQALPIGDSRIVVDVTPNRPDLLSHFGLARELSAATGVSLRHPASALAGWKHPVRSAVEGICDGVTVRIDDTEGCTRYVGAIIRGVTVEQSPQWMKMRLEAIGARPVNNIVDITNIILHETGQPLHAFDLLQLRGNAVIIRDARPGETLETLDGVTRELSTGMTVIADAERAHAVAGVMGGQDSAVASTTRDIFLEIATFDSARVRATRQKLGMSTDASYRFERGVDPHAPSEVAMRAIGMVLDIAGGELADAPLDLYPSPRARTTIALRASRIERVLGVHIPAESVAGMLQSIGFLLSTSESDQDLLEVTVPAWRVDVCEEIDLIEEVARLYGYNSFPDEIRPFRPGTSPDDPVSRVARVLRSELAAMGMLEARPLPFAAGDDRTHVRITNPISEDERHLRRSIVETLATRAEYNLARMQRNVRLFEVGNVFKPHQGGAGLPVESVNVGVLVVGDRIPAHFTDPQPPAFDEWDAKAVAEELAALLANGERFELRPEDGRDGLLWSIVGEHGEVGHVRRVQLDAPVWAAPAYGIELVVARLDANPEAPPGQNAYADAAADTLTGSVQARSGGRKYRVLPAFPAATFDLALLVPDVIAAATVESAMQRTAGDMLESVALFDEFRGSSVPSGMRSLAWRLTFRHPERTLRDKEVEGRRQKLLTALEKELGVRQRTS